MLYSLLVLSNKMSPFMQNIYIYIYIWFKYLIFQPDDYIPKRDWPSRGGIIADPDQGKLFMLCYLLITSLNNCVNIFEVIKLLILFYFWKVLFSFSTYRGSHVNGGLYFGYCLFTFGYFYFLHFRCKNSQILFKNMLCIYIYIYIFFF